MPFDRTRDLAVFIIGGITVGVDILVVFLFSVTPTAPMWLSLTLTGVLGVVIIASYLQATRTYLLTPARRDSDQEKPVRQRVSDVIVSVTVLGPMTVLVGIIGGSLLTALVRAGGPDPSFGGEEPLRRQLMRWSKRNREFLRTRGEGELPIRLE